MNASIDVMPMDWGAWGKLKAEYEIDKDVWSPIYCAEGETYITIPRDERGGIENHIADQWEIDNNLTEGIATMQDEEGSKKRGDGLTAYEEYRGFMIGGSRYGVHICTEPEKYINLFVHPSGWQVMNIIDDGTVINNEIKINILVFDFDYVSDFVRIINPNRGEWSVCEQHGLLFENYNIPKPYVLGETLSRIPGSPKDAEYCRIDISELERLNKPYKQYLNTSIHELMHGCGVDHHGDDNVDITLRSDSTSNSYSFALWNGVNAGGVSCVLQYGWGDYFRRANGILARDENDNLIPFVDKQDKVVYNHLCNSNGTNKHPQLGMAANGDCLSQVGISDE